MQSIISALSWEYYARNRWMLLYLPLIANIPVISVLVPLKSISPDAAFMTSPLLIGIQMILILCMVLLACFGVLTTQGGLKRLYRLPLSTVQIASYYFCSGALLVGAQVALMLWLWKVLLPIDWPIAGPVLFSVVCWCALQPVVRGQSQSLWWIVLAVLIVIALFFWLLRNHGIPLQSGGMLTHQIHYWTGISRADWLITIVSLSLAYWLTTLRVTYDRSGRRKTSLFEKIDLAWERVQSRWNSGSRNFNSAIQAFSGCHFRSGPIAIPMLAIGSVILTWMIAGLVSIIQQDSSTLLRFAIGGTYLSTMLQVYMAFLFGILGLFGSSLTRFEAPEQEPKASNSQILEVSPFMDSLPINSIDKSFAVLRSSGRATVLSSAAVILSYLLITIISFLLGNPLQSGEGIEIKSFKYLGFLTTSAMLLTYVFNNLKFSIAPSLMRIDHWIWPIIVIAVLLAFRIPLGLCLSAGLCVFALVALVYSTIQSLIDKDLSVRTASLIWLVGIAIAVGLLAVLRNEFGPVGMLLAASLVGLVMLPFFSTAAGLRRARTT
jgi:hypothetical protein